MDTTVNGIVVLSPGVGTRHVAEYPAGAVSDGWNEVEWRNVGDEEDGRFFAGVWTGSPGTAELPVMPFDEICILRSGRIRFSDQSGDSREFEAGDALYVPRGFSGRWEILEHTEMTYVALGPF